MELAMFNLSPSRNALHYRRGEKIKTSPLAMQRGDSYE
jgi:hypothetical protein